MYVCRVLFCKSEGKRDHLGDLGVDGRMTFKWILQR